MYIYYLSDITNVSQTNTLISPKTCATLYNFQINILLYKSKQITSNANTQHAEHGRCHIYTEVVYVCMQIRKYPASNGSLNTNSTSIGTTLYIKIGFDLNMRLIVFALDRSERNLKGVRRVRC